MSHTATHLPLKSTNATLSASGTALIANLLMAGGILLLVIGLFGVGSTVEESAFAWLYSFLFFFTIAAGSLFWSVVHHAVHAAWTTIFRRLWENLASLLPVLAVFFAPLIMIGPTIYRWMQPEVIANDAALHEKIGYLTGWFFYVRAILYFLVFISIALYYRRLSVSQDRTGSPVPSAIMQKKSYVLLALYGLSITYASFDWIMSLDYHWASTMFGVTIFAGSATASVAVVILLTLGFQKAGYLEMVNEEHYHLLGKVLFSFVTFWAWVAFSQYLFIWYANIPEETVFFIDRSKGSWATLAHAMILFNFLIPFFVLLLQATKRSAFWLAVTASSVLLGHAMELYWLVMPTIHPEGCSFHWILIVTLLGMGMVLSSVFLRRCFTDAIYPVKDPRLVEALGSHN